MSSGRWFQFHCHHQGRTAPGDGKVEMPVQSVISEPEIQATFLPRRRRGTGLLGLVLILGLIIAASHFSELREFVRLAEQAEPWWLLVAVALQLGTYVAQGETWRAVAMASEFPLSRRLAARLTLGKLFVDQSLPTAGVPGTLLVASSLEGRGLPRAAARAGVVVYTVSNQAAFVVCLAAGLAVAAVEGEATRAIVLISTVALLVGAAVAMVAAVFAGRPTGALPRLGARIAPLRVMLQGLAEADPRLVRRPGLLLRASTYQLGALLLDAATVWALLRAMGVMGSPTGVFASFAIANAFRMIGILPGGLGTFEAASVLTLTLGGVSVAAALSATLLFRALSFWLPMLPGWWSVRGLQRPAPAVAQAELGAYWSLQAAEVARRLNTGDNGLSSADAAERLLKYGSGELPEQRPPSRLRVLLRQFRSPLLLLLIFAAVASLLTRELVDAAIVLTIVLATVGIGYSREYGAQTAAAVLRARLTTRAMVVRDGQPASTPLGQIVPGDMVILSAGGLVPGDGVIIDATDFFVSEAVLTGESFPVEKKSGTSSPSATLAERGNCVFLGTNVRSGTARCLMVRTGPATEYGAIAHRLIRQRPETEFDRGTRRFGYFLTVAMLVLVLVVFVAHVMRGRPPAEMLLFSLALAVGLSPELLPAVLSVNLARGAKMMADHGVLVRRLNAIENLGSMDVLCTDKTGTLTEGDVRLQGAYDPAGNRSDPVLELGARNAALQTGLSNPLDVAILAARTPELSQVHKLAEIPFDFVRKRVSVVLEEHGAIRLITKGAFPQVIDVCSRGWDGVPLGRAEVARLQAQFDGWCDQGIRVLAVASRQMETQPTYGRDDEHDLAFLGLLTFFDRPKEGAREAIADLGRLGVAVKLITGDSRRVGQHVARLVGLSGDRLLTGAELDQLHDEALWHAAERTDLFLEVDPNQKERIILALKKTGHVVGFLGDGVNDAPAMHAADTSLSVDQAVDVAREAADFVLLERDLDVIRRGIEAGRRTFANTLKYVRITTSANLGNMLSMATASFFLPFLPLLPGQILLNNFLSDIPAIGIAGDNVDPELVDRPRRWNIQSLGRSMIGFGVLSAGFDFLTFALLLGLYRASENTFRTGWFVESLLTELVIALIMRTQRPFFRSRPGTVLWASTVALIVVAFAIPYLPFMGLFGFAPLPGSLIAMVAGITVLYVAATELVKREFVRTPREMLLPGAL